MQLPVWDNLANCPTQAIAAARPYTELQTDLSKRLALEDVACLHARYCANL